MNALNTLPDPRVMLLECHVRIRRTMDGLQQLAALDDLTDPRVEPTAQAIARYLRVGLPLHAEDEDASLMPRLLALPIPVEVKATLGQLHEEHDDIDLLSAQVLAWLDGLSSGQLRRPSWAVERLVALLLRHIETEEAQVLPLLDAIPPAERAEMSREMRARRLNP